MKAVPPNGMFPQRIWGKNPTLNAPYLLEGGWNKPIIDQLPRERPVRMLRRAAKVVRMSKAAVRQRVKAPARQRVG